MYALRPLIALLVSFVFQAVFPASSPAQEGYRTLVPEPGSAPAEKRTALVIGNSAYDHARPLQNPGNDATDMARALQKLGFRVITGTDLSQEAMERAVDSFASESEGAAVALVFYAGHGVEVKGENYLVPVDARIDSEADIKYRTVSAGKVLGRVKSAVGDGLSVLMLDACRDNPFRSWRSSGGGGLSAMNGPSGSIIAYATSPGNVASDNEQGRNGLYTQMLLEEIARPGVEMSEMLRAVNARVAKASAGEQQPWVASSYVNDFYLVRGRHRTAPPVDDEVPEVSDGERQRALRDEYWTIHAAAEDGHIEAVEAFLAASVSIDAPDNDGRTPLHYALFERHAVLVRHLLDRGASLETKDKEGRTPLHVVAREVAPNELGRLLLARGADIEARDNAGRTPLYSAALYGETDAARLFLEHGADVNAKTKHDATPLHGVTWGNVGAIARLLLENGADVSAKNAKGQTALAAAREGFLLTAANQRALIRVLEEFGARE